MKWSFLFSIFLFGCGSDGGDNGDCACRTNPDGTFNFKVDTAHRTMVLKVNGETYLKEDLDVEAASLDLTNRWAVWKTMKNGKNVKHEPLIESLEACSLLHVWKKKGLYHLLGTDTSGVQLPTNAL